MVLSLSVKSFCFDRCTFLCVDKQGAGLASPTCVCRGHVCPAWRPRTTPTSAAALVTCATSTSLMAMTPLPTPQRHSYPVSVSSRTSVWLDFVVYLQVAPVLSHPSRGHPSRRHPSQGHPSNSDQVNRRESFFAGRLN